MKSMHNSGLTNSALLEGEMAPLPHGIKASEAANTDEDGNQDEFEKIEDEVVDQGNQKSDESQSVDIDIDINLSDVEQADLEGEAAAVEQVVQQQVQADAESSSLEEIDFENSSGSSFTEIAIEGHDEIVDKTKSETQNDEQTLAHNEESEVEKIDVHQSIQGPPDNKEGDEDALAVNKENTCSETESNEIIVVAGGADEGASAGSGCIELGSFSSKRSHSSCSNSSDKVSVIESTGKVKSSIEIAAVAAAKVGIRSSKSSDTFTSSSPELVQKAEQQMISSASSPGVIELRFSGSNSSSVKSSPKQHLPFALADLDFRGIRKHDTQGNEVDDDDDDDDEEDGHVIMSHAKPSDLSMHLQRERPHRISNKQAANIQNSRKPSINSNNHHLNAAPNVKQDYFLVDDSYQQKFQKDGQQSVYQYEQVVDDYEQDKESGFVFVLSEHKNSNANVLQEMSVLKQFGLTTTATPAMNNNASACSSVSRSNEKHYSSEARLCVESTTAAARSNKIDSVSVTPFSVLSSPFESYHHQKGESATVNRTAIDRIIDQPKNTTTSTNNNTSTNLFLESSILTASAVKGMVTQENSLMGSQSTLSEQKQSLQPQQQPCSSVDSPNETIDNSKDSKSTFDETLLLDRDSSTNNSKSIIKQHNALSILNTFVLLACIGVYGYLIPRRKQYVLQSSDATWIVISGFLCTECLWRLFTYKTLLNFKVAFSLILFLANSLLPTSFDMFLDMLFFTRFLVSLWECNSFSLRVHTITEVIRSAAKPNIEILSFILAVCLLFNVIAGILNNNHWFPNLNAISFSFNISLNNHPPYYITMLLEYSIMFFARTVGQSLITVVNKVSIERLSQQQAQQQSLLRSKYSCRFLAVFKHNNAISYLFRNKLVYAISQSLFISAICYTQNNLPYMTCIGGALFLAYEVSIDVALQTGPQIAKNLIYICVMIFPGSYPLLAIVALYACISAIPLFKQITRAVDAIITDILFTLLLNQLIIIAYPNSTFLPVLTEIFIVLPLLKAIVLSNLDVFDTPSITTDQLNLPIILQQQQRQQQEQQPRHEKVSQLISYDNDDVESNTNNTNKSNRHNIDDTFEQYDDSNTSADMSTTLKQHIYKNLSSSQQLVHDQKRRINNASKSFFILSEFNIIRRASTLIVNSSIFKIIYCSFFFVTAIYELSRFPALADRLELPYSNILTAYIDPALIATYISLKSIAYGFLFNQRSFLRKSFRDLLLFTSLLLQILQPYVDQDNYYLGSIRIVYLLMLLPLRSSKLNAIIKAISKTKSMITQIVLLSLAATTVLLILTSTTNPQQQQDWQVFVNKALYNLAVSMLILCTLGMFSKQQMLQDSSVSVWQIVKKKALSFELNFYYLSKQAKKSTGVFATFLRSNRHQQILNVSTALVYSTLFVLIPAEKYLDISQQDAQIIALLDAIAQTRKFIIAGLSYAIIFYAFIHIRVYNLLPFIFSSTANKVLFLQSLSLALLIAIEVFVEDDVGESSLQVQFLLQLPILLRTIFMLPLVKFKNSIIRQMVITVISSCIFLVALERILRNPELAVQEYIQLSFNVQANAFAFESYQKLLQSNALFAIAVLAHGIAGSFLLLDIIRKYDFSESNQAKRKYKRMLCVFEQLWDMYKAPQNPCLMPASSLMEFLAEFDKEITSENDNNNLDQLKRIQRMKIKIDEAGSVYYKDLLFRLAAEQFNENIYQQVGRGISNSDLEFNQSPETRRWKVFSPITKQLYARLVFCTWQKYAQMNKHTKPDDDNDNDNEDKNEPKGNYPSQTTIALPSQSIDSNKQLFSQAAHHGHFNLP